MPKPASKLQGLRLAALYSVGCPDLRDQDSIIRVFLRTTFPNREMVGRVREALKRTEAFLFYVLFASRNGVSDYFAEEVVRTHWLPDAVPQPITQKEAQVLIALGTDGVIPDYPKKNVNLAKITQLVELPPHHNFAVFQPLRAVKIGTILPPEFLVMINGCLLKPERVVRVCSFRQIDVETLNLGYEGDRLILRSLKERRDQGFADGIGPGDFVVSHFGKARQKITQREATVLSTITANAFSYLVTGRV